MLQSWRWFGPSDPVPLHYIRQAGATDIVSSLHDIPIGEAWNSDAIAQHQALVEANNKPGSKLSWSVVESIPVHDSIKRADRDTQRYIDAYKDSLQALAEAGIKTVCYNFMPLLDWTRTDLSWSLPTGGKALRFDATAFAAFDLFILKRKAAPQDLTSEQITHAENTFKAYSESQKNALTQNILSGLPGATTGGHTLAGFRRKLDDYRDIGHAELFNNLTDFLRQILPVAEQLGMKLAIHPDDPPRTLLGLPRIISCRNDLVALFTALPSSANGLTFCTGSFGAGPHNNLVAMVTEFAQRIHFAHLRGTHCEIDGKSFHEAEHLNSDVDMLSIIELLLREERRRRTANPSDRGIPFRPDHGHQILDDLDKTCANPGYSHIGRMKGLAELRGAILALERGLERQQK